MKRSHRQAELAADHRHRAWVAAAPAREVVRRKQAAQAASAAELEAEQRRRDLAAERQHERQIAFALGGAGAALMGGELGGSMNGGRHGELMSLRSGVGLGSRYLQPASGPGLFRRATAAMAGLFRRRPAALGSTTARVLTSRTNPAPPAPSPAPQRGPAMTARAESITFTARERQILRGLLAAPAVPAAPTATPAASGRAELLARNGIDADRAAQLRRRYAFDDQADADAEAAELLAAAAGDQQQEVLERHGITPERRVELARRGYK